MAATVFSEHGQHEHNKQLSPAPRNTAALQAIEINKWISRVKARFFLFLAVAWTKSNWLELQAAYLYACFF